MRRNKVFNLNGFHVPRALNDGAEKGRSMVEMLGVLAVIGVLSIGGITGYRQAMTTHKANEFLNDLSTFFVSARSAVEAGQKEGDIKIKGENWFYTTTSFNDFAAMIPVDIDVDTCKQLATRINNSTFDILRGSSEIEDWFYFYTTTSGQSWLVLTEAERKEECVAGANNKGIVHFTMGF